MIVPETILTKASRSQRAFTLVEMLAVIAVMLLMLKLTLPSLDGLLGAEAKGMTRTCLLYTSPSPRDKRQSRMPSSA